MTIGERLKTAIAAKTRDTGEPYSQSDLARAIEVTPQTVQQWASGDTSPRRARISAIAKELDCDPVWLETGSDAFSAGAWVASKIRGKQVQAEKEETTARDRNAIPVRYYPGVPASAGHGCVPLDEANVTVLEIARSLLDSCGVAPGNAALLQADGDSMRGVIEHGDLMIIDTSANDLGALREGRVFVVSVDGELLVKKVQRIPRGIKLVSENKTYDPITIMNDDQDADVRLVGRVALSWSMTGFM